MNNMNAKARNTVGNRLTLDLQLAVSATANAPRLPSRAQFRAWAEAALASRRQASELTIRIVDETESAQLNQDYRGKDGPTNVLSFPFTAPSGITLPLIGDLVICAPVVVREAEQQHKEIAAHWAHMVIHGCLHLLGYDHETEAQAETMEALERQLLAAFGYADPYSS